MVYLVPFLLELSSRTQSMFIDAVACSEYNFGVENGHWVSIIHDMFSRKLDKLFLFTNLCDTFLPIAGAETLKQVDKGILEEETRKGSND